ncbi:MAG: LapA family protein [Gammaproteobacteria bacterium]|nr:LapA family protein [Gammaproteobacteria bacterium]MDX5374727.1 LapA family protein [Gammaproteobacteria bacterium]
MKRLATFLLLVLVVLVVMAFTVLNTETVAIDVYFYQAAIPVSVLIFLSLIVGALLGVFGSLGMTLQQRVELRRLRKQLASSEQEIVELRKIPGKDTE